MKIKQHREKRSSLERKTSNKLKLKKQQSLVGVVYEEDKGESKGDEEKMIQVRAAFKKYEISKTSFKCLKAYYCARNRQSHNFFNIDPSSLGAQINEIKSKKINFRF